MPHSALKLARPGGGAPDQGGPERVRQYPRSHRLGAIVTPPRPPDHRDLITWYICSMPFSSFLIHSAILPNTTFRSLASYGPV